MDSLSGNTNSIDTLYRMHVNALFSYGLHLGFDRETCKDALHDVFCKLCADTALLASVGNEKLYLLRALRNRLLDLYRQKKEYTEFPPEAETDELPFTVQITIEDKLISSEEAEHIRSKVEKMLQTLTDRQREIIYLRYTQECEYEEIATLMNLTVHSCRKLVHKAISKLKLLTE